jgi:tetratricopeptide (TPR) repeat protein
MQVNQFIHFLEHSNELSSVTESEFSAVLKDFPYCQTGQLMLAINLNLNNSILFEEQLKRAAAICPDRTKLFEHIQQRNQEEVVEVQQEVEKVVQQEVPEVITVPVVAEELIEAIAIPPEIKTEEPKEKFAPVAGEDELALLEKGYLTAAISSSILLESDKTAEIPPTKKEVEKEVELFDEEVSHSFSTWLKHYHDEGALKTDDLNKKPVNSEDIIDRFIQEDPRIKPKKTAFYSPTNMARISVTDSGIVSETLALIHVDQGSFQEAIDAYEKLMLKNPKKRSYFAAQIKILKQKLK